MKYLLILLGFVFPILLTGQDQSARWMQKLEQWKVRPVIGLQLWSSYTFGTEVFDAASGKYEAVDNRLNFQLRRSRLGIKGQPYENLKFNVTAALDLVGRDIFAGTEAGANNGASPRFRLWNAYVQWRVRSKSEALNVAAGYLLPQIGRESITSALRSTSLEKAWSQNYLRVHLAGTGAGRAVGVNLGGLILPEAGKIGMGYDVGIFNPSFDAFGGNSVGRHYAPLVAGRMAFFFGDPEAREYAFSHQINHFGKRKGLTLALAGATQGRTDLFAGNHAAGFDVLFNWDHLNIDGEWMTLWREGSRLRDEEIRAFKTSAHTGYIRLSYNFDMKNQYTLEPVLMVMGYEGAMQAVEQADAAAAGTPFGKDHTIDIGLNLYPNQDLKWSLHYTLRDGDPGASGDGAKVNNYFFQSDAGAIHRGDWLGLGLTAIF